MIVKDGNKYEIVYNRALTVSRPVWQDNNRNYETTPFNGFGLKKGSGSISPVGGNWGNVTVFGGIAYEEIGSSLNDYPVVNDWTAYKSALEYAGLHPSQKDSSNNPVLLNHSRVNITAAGSNANVMANGMYDFVLAYYNPASNGSVVGTDLKARLPNWPTSGLTLDGQAVPAGVTTTTRPAIGTQATNANPRKAALDGMPNEGYLNNITVAMANYMRSNLNISEFKNTNILGDGSQWNGTNTMDLPFLTNVGLIGNYGGIAVNNGLNKRIRGILDITGTAPNTISNDSRNGYLNLYNVSGNMGVNRFYVVSIKDLNNIDKVNAGNPWATSAEPASVIIYPKKYATNLLSNESANLKPAYRAFLDGNTLKITPVTGSPTVNAAYKGTDTNGSTQVPPLDEASWINAANSNNGAAPAFQSYSAAPKWDNTAFNAVPVE